MNDYLGNLVARQLDQAESVQPRLALRFEPPALRLPGAQTSMGGIERLETDETSNELELESEASVGLTLDGQPRPAEPQRSTTMLELTERDSPSLSSRATRESDAPLRPTTASEQSPAQVTSSVDSTQAQASSQSTSEQDFSSSSSSEIHASAKASSVRPSPAPLTSRRSLTEVHVSTNQQRGEAVAQQESRSTPTQDVMRKLAQKSGQPEKPDSAQLIQPLHQSTRDDARARGERMTGKQNDMPQSTQNHLVPRDLHEIEQPAPLSNNSLPVTRLRDTDESPRGNRSPAPLEQASETPARSSRPQPNVLVQPRVTHLVESRVLAHDESNSARGAEPVINVTIGRVEVRATHAPAANRRQNASAPLMSLNDYLRQRAGGGGR